MKSEIHVTYTKRSANRGASERFAVACPDEVRARAVGYDLASRPEVSNIRMNRCGRGLPESAFIIPFHEYLNETK